MAEGRTKDTSAPAIWRGGTVEAALRLGATALIRAARERHPAPWRRWADGGDAALLPVPVPLTRDGVPAGETPVTLALHGPRAAAALPDGSAALVIVPTNVGGLRWWWLCPVTGDTCAALYLPPGAERFASRQAHELRHRSLSERPVARAARKARKLRTRLGEAPAVLGGRLPDMPPRMRWPTYERLCDAIRKAEERVKVTTLRLIP